MIGAYKLFTTTSLDVSSVKIKNLQEEINKANKINDSDENIKFIENMKFTKIQMYDFQNHPYYMAYIKEISSLSIEEYLQINKVFERIIEILKKDDNAEYDYKDLFKQEIGSEIDSYRAYYLNPYGTYTYYNQILLYTKKIRDYNNHYPNDQYDSSVFVLLKSVDEINKEVTNYSFITNMQNIFNSTYANKDSLIKFNNKTIADDAAKFNELVNAKIKNEEVFIKSIENKKTELKSELNEEEDRIQKNQFYIYNSLAIKAFTSIMLFLLVKMFMELFKYTLRMSVFHSTKASLISLMYELKISDPEKLKDIFHSEAIDFQSPDATDFIKAVIESVKK